jgi:hypothetical protein
MLVVDWLLAIKLEFNGKKQYIHMVSMNYFLIKNVIRANHMISLITSATTDPSFIGGTINLPKVTDLYHIMLYWVHFAMNGVQTILVQLPYDHEVNACSWLTTSY